MSIVCLYHADCYDGFGAAWAAWRALGDRARYVPVQHGERPPDLDAGDEVYILDFCYPRTVLNELRSHSLQLQVLDHHATAARHVAGVDWALIDPSRSGARIAWDHFHAGVEPPALIDYIEDRDLGRNTLPDSREVSAWLQSHPMELKLWTDLDRRLAEHLAGAVAEGRIVRRHQARQVDAMCRQARIAVIAGHEVPVTNATVLFSEVAEELAGRNPGAAFAAVYWDRADGKRQWGLRAPGGFDVSAPALALGGGGHAHAAGFVEDRAGSLVRIS